MAEPVEIVNVWKSFGAFHALKGVSLSIRPGELFFLLGPSGCGKTTLLRTVAGFCPPDAGSVYIGSRDVTGLRPERRGTGMVFQSYALWPHLTIAENVSFGLEMRGVPRAERQTRVLAALRTVHLESRANDRPNSLSGGQQQRVALARALVVDPSCLLLDEPLSNLDAKLRQEMRTEIRSVCKSRGFTAMYVTHDRQEALSCADRIAVMDGGGVMQVGTPAEVYRQPISAFVASFMGEANLFDGYVAAEAGESLLVETPQGQFEARFRERRFSVGEKVSLCIRPESLRTVDAPAAGRSKNTLSGHLVGEVYLGEMTQRKMEISSVDAEGNSKVVTIFEMGALPASSKIVSYRAAPSDIVVMGRSA